MAIPRGRGEPDKRRVGAGGGGIRQPTRGRTKARLATSPQTTAQSQTFQGAILTSLDPQRQAMADQEWSLTSMLCMQLADQQERVGCLEQRLEGTEAIGRHWEGETRRIEGEKANIIQDLRRTEGELRHSHGEVSTLMGEKSLLERCNHHLANRVHRLEMRQMVTFIAGIPANKKRKVLESVSPSSSDEADLGHQEGTRKSNLEAR